MMLGDMRRKELALGHIKRLASSGLSLEPFGRAVLDLINDGVPRSPNRVILAGGSDRIDGCIGSTQGIAASERLECGRGCRGADPSLRGAETPELLICSSCAEAGGQDRPGLSESSL